MGARRRLTDRQTAVLAALERRGPSTLLDLQTDFPHLTPSAIARVLEGLTARGHVRARGDAALVYLGGVRYTAVSCPGEPEHDEEVASLLAAIAASERWSAWADRDRHAVVVALPFTAILEALDGSPRNDFDELRDLLARLRRDGAAAWTVIDSEVTVDGCEPALRVVVGVRGDVVERRAGDEPVTAT